MVPPSEILKFIIMRKYLYFPVAFTMIVLLLFRSGISFARENGGKKDGNDAYEVLSLVNQVRAARGLAELQMNGALLASAQAHSDYQASIGSTTHTGAGGTNPVDRAIAAGYGGGAKIYLSENIYGGMNTTPAQAVGWWQGDAPHLNTMINPGATDAGVGVATGGSVVYYTLDAGYVAGSPGSGYVAKPQTTSVPLGGTAAPTKVIIKPLVMSTPKPDGSIVHVVQSGQALWNIAAVYKISLADLLALNGLSSNSVIHPGDKILVKGPSGAAATSTLTVTATITNTMTQTVTTQAPPTAAVVMENIAPTQTMAIATAFDQNSNTFESVKSPVKTMKVDPFLIIIAALVVIGTALIVVGGLFRQAGQD